MVLSLNDDRLIMEFLSGRYTGEPQGYGIHVKFPLSYLIAFLYRIAPDYDWYGYTMLGLMTICVILVCLRIARMTEGRRNKWIAVAGVLALTVFAVGEQFVSITYSIVAAVTGATILFLYGTTDGRKSDILVLGILSAVTWCLRYHLFYMILPVAGLIWLYRDVFVKKSLIAKIATPLVVLLFVGTSMLINYGMYSSPEWKEFEAFNTSRITIYDNPNDYYFPGYEEKQEYYKELELENVERRLLIYYGLLLGRDEIPTDTFHKMVEIRENYGDNESEYLSTKFVSGTKSYAKRLLSGQCGMVYYAGCAGFVLLLLLVGRRKQWAEFIKILLVFGAQIMIFWAMEMNGRMPQRVIDSLAIMLFMTMGMVAVWEKEHFLGGNHCKIAAGIVCGILFVAGSCRSLQIYQENKAIVLLNHEKESVVAYCNEHSENFYYMSTGYLCTSGYNFYFGKVDNSQMNYMSTGDWISYSPMQQERLEQEGWESAVDSLIQGENVYLIAGDNKYQQYFRDYLEYRCGNYVEPIIEDAIGSVYVYRYEMHHK